MARARYSKHPSDPAAILRALRAHRDLMIKVRHEVGFHSPYYKRAAEINAAIDGMVELLTGDKTYLGLAADSIPIIPKEPPQRELMERGEIPWEWPEPETKKGR
jgi:hypothetical protein